MFEVCPFLSLTSLLRSFSLPIYSWLHGAHAKAIEKTFFCGVCVSLSITHTSTSHISVSICLFLFIDLSLFFLSLSRYICFFLCHIHTYSVSISQTQTHTLFFPLSLFPHLPLLYYFFRSNFLALPLFLLPGGGKLEKQASVSEKALTSTIHSHPLPPNTHTFPRPQRTTSNWRLKFGLTSSQKEKNTN